MASSRMLRHVALVRTEVSKESFASIFMVKIISELGKTLVTDYFHPDDGGDMFLTNVFSYKSHTA
jgi:hypothetical protein